MNPPGSDVAFVFVSISIHHYTGVDYLTISVNAKLLATKNVSIGMKFAHFGRFFIDNLWLLYIDRNGLGFGFQT